MKINVLIKSGGEVKLNYDDCIVGGDTINIYDKGDTEMVITTYENNPFKLLWQKIIKNINRD